MKYVIASMVVILVVGLAIVLLSNIYFPRIDARYATRGYVRYHYGGKDIDAQVDNDDLAVLKDILAGRSYRDSPSCGFDADVSIRLTDGRKSVVLCPACDTCPKIRIGDSDRYISISKEQRERLDALLARYGMVFPCM